MKELTSSKCECFSHRLLKGGVLGEDGGPGGLGGGVVVMVDREVMMLSYG